MPDAQLIGILEIVWRAGRGPGLAVFRQVLGGWFEARRNPDETLTPGNRVTKNERSPEWVCGSQLQL